jgi:hypothetical protein
MERNQFIQDISLIYGKVTEQIFFQIRELIVNSLMFVEKQLVDISDHPNLKEYFYHLFSNEIVKNIEQIKNISQESLLTLLYYYSEFLSNIIDIIQPFEPSLTKSLFNEIFLPSLFSDKLLTSEYFDVFIKNNGNILSTERVVQEIQELNYKSVFLLIPPLLSDETIWESTYQNQTTIDNLLKNKNIYTIKFQFDPAKTIQENSQILYSILKDIFDNLEKKIQFNVIAFSTGNYIIRYLINYYNDFFINKFYNLIMINSPELGVKLERIILWAGFLYKYAPKTSINILKILTDENFKIINDFDNSILFSKQFLQKEKEIFKQYKINKIYSLITENNSMWSPWLGDGLIEEPSLSFHNEDISEKNISTINGTSHLQIIPSAELRNILHQII